MGLMALGISPTDQTQIQPYYSSTSQASPVQAMSVADMRKLEASHLEVYAGCKWGHAAFDPIRVDAEVVPSDILALYAQMV